MYGVIVCPRCRRAKGVDLVQKTTACVCGFDIHVTPARVRARADTARELASLVGRVNAELRGGTRAYEEAAEPPRRRRSSDVHTRVAASVGAGDRMHRVRAAAVALSRELERFSFSDWTIVLERLGIPDPQAALEHLIQERAIYEPATGFYRAVSLTP